MKKLLCAVAAALTMTSALAWPDKPVTMVVPFPPGGSTDLITRTLIPKLQDKVGGTLIVDNKAGATGTIGAGAVVRSPADGERGKRPHQKGQHRHLPWTEWLWEIDASESSDGKSQAG